MGTFTSRQRTFSLPAVGGLASSGADVRLNSRRPLLRRDRPKFTNAQGRSPAAGLPAHAKALLHARHLPVPIDASQLASHARLSHRAAQESGRPTPRRTTSTLRAARPRRLSKLRYGVRDRGPSRRYLFLQVLGPDRGAVRQLPGGRRLLQPRTQLAQVVVGRRRQAVDPVHRPTPPLPNRWQGSVACRLGYPPAPGTDYTSLEQGERGAVQLPLRRRRRRGNIHQHKRR